MMDTHLTALIGSRICHDLISPLGAIGNGVELLSMSGVASAPELALIEESVENANARIRFYRIAFGAAGADAPIGTAEVNSVLADMFQGSRLTVTTSFSSDPLRRDVKLAFLLLLCAETAMPWGGTITIVESASGWKVHCQAERLKRTDALWARATGPTLAEPVSPAQVQFALTPLAAEDAGRRPSIVWADDAFTLSF